MNFNDPKYYDFDRRIVWQNHTAFIYPFIGQNPNSEAVELVFDTNAVIHPKDWMFALDQRLLKAENVVLNPHLAWVEQWLSNEQFLLSSTDKINKALESFGKYKCSFAHNYAEIQSQNLCKSDQDLRFKFAMLFGYIAIAKLLLDAKESFEWKCNKLVEISNERDFPRFSGMLMFIAITLYFQKYQKVKITGDTKPVFSYLESFFAFQSGNKNEKNYLNLSYLRNRSGDLTLWYSMPMLFGSASDQQLSVVGNPVVVTGDKALNRVIFRLLPPSTTNGSEITFVFADKEIPSEYRDDLNRFVKSINTQFSPPKDEQEKLFRLECLMQRAVELTNISDEKNELNRILSECIAPCLDSDRKQA